MYNETNLENILGERPRMQDPNFPSQIYYFKISIRRENAF